MCEQKRFTNERRYQVSSCIGTRNGLSNGKQQSPENIHTHTHTDFVKINETLAHIHSFTHCDATLLCNINDKQRNDKTSKTCMYIHIAIDSLFLQNLRSSRSFPRARNLNQDPLFVNALYIIHHTSYIIHHTSYHTSYIIHHTSHIIHHTSHTIPFPYTCESTCVPWPPFPAHRNSVVHPLLCSPRLAQSTRSPYQS